MNDKSLNSILLAAIIFTALLVIGVHFIPDTKLVLLPESLDQRQLPIQPLPDGTPSSEWINDTHTAWKCTYPKSDQTGQLRCVVTLSLSTADGVGIDLSDSDQLVLHLNYTGKANKIRIAIRNYNPAYTTPGDYNSTKFNAIKIHTNELNKEIHIPLSAFTVADWWLNDYNIPFSRSTSEMDNVTAIIIDFEGIIEPGLHTFEIEKIEAHGEWLHIEYWYLAILCTWMLGIFIYSVKRLLELHAQTKHDTQVINDLKQETDKFRRLSTVDPLTQLYNRFGIDQIIASLSGNNYLQASDNPHYSLLMIDIDHFKRINDQRGHDIGDLVLQHIAKTIQTQLRAGDYVGRWGGEEFVAILPGLNKEAAMDMAEIIRVAIFSTPCELDKPLSVSASFGVSERNDGEDFATCFKRADNALYKAKAQGRNCCIYAEETL